MADNAKKRILVFQKSKRVTQFRNIELSNSTKPMNVRYPTRKGKRRSTLTVNRPQTCNAWLEAIRE